MWGHIQGQCERHCQGDGDEKARRNSTGSVEIEVWLPQKL